MNADSLSGVITSRNPGIEKPSYRAIFIGAEVFWEDSHKKQEILILAK